MLCWHWTDPFQNKNKSYKSAPSNSHARLCPQNSTAIPPTSLLSQVISAHEVYIPKFYALFFSARHTKCLPNATLSPELIHIYLITGRACNTHTILTQPLPPTINSHPTYLMWHWVTQQLITYRKTTFQWTVWLWQAPDNPNTYFVNELNSLRELTKNSPEKKKKFT